MIPSTVLYIAICLLLIILVLIQQGGSGMGIISGGSDTILGSNEGNILTKMTTFLAVLFIVGALAMSVISAGDKTAIDREKPAQSTTPTDELDKQDDTTLIDGTETDPEVPEGDSVPASD